MVHGQDSRDFPRLRYELGRSHRETATSLGIANSTVTNYVRWASAAGFSWPLPEGLDDTALFPPSSASRVRRPEPGWGHVHRELQRHKCPSPQEPPEGEGSRTWTAGATSRRLTALQRY